jgi:hypothetical protein
MALVTHYDLELHQMDVKTDFLNESCGLTRWLPNKGKRTRGLQIK